MFIISVSTRILPGEFTLFFGAGIFVAGGQYIAKQDCNVATLRYIEGTGITMEFKLGKYLFMRRFLENLASAGFFSKMVAIMLRVLAALIVLGSLASIFSAGKFMFNLPPSGIMGGIMYVLFFMLAIYAVAHTLIIRATDIESQQNSEQFILPIASILTKLAGEAYATYVALNAIGGGIFVWFTGEPIGKIMNPVPFLFPTMQKPNFMGGIELIVAGVLLATGALIVSYVVAELITALSRSAADSQKTGAPTGPRHITEHNSRSGVG